MLSIFSSISEKDVLTAFLWVHEQFYHGRLQKVIDKEIFITFEWSKRWSLSKQHEDHVHLFEDQDDFLQAILPKV